MKREIEKQHVGGLTASNVHFAYGAHQVLHGVGFEMLRPGHLTALLGPNASGKSTLFRVIAGLLRASAGRIELDGIDLDTLHSRQRLSQVCFMPQFFATNAALSVFDVVMMAHKHLHSWRVSDDDMQAVGQTLHDCGIGHLSEAYVGELSGGQAQMVSVAQALIRKAQVYLFDEPTSALDLRHKLDVLSRIRQCVRNRQAIGIIALHDLNLAAQFADHLLLLGQGHVLAQGTPHTVLNDPAIASTYGVEIEISQGPRKELLVHAYA